MLSLAKAENAKLIRISQVSAAGPAYSATVTPILFAKNVIKSQILKEIGRHKLLPHMKIDDIISYDKIVSAEKVNLQKGMNFGIGKGYSVFLMSVRKNAPYADAVDESTGTLIYEGHDHPKTHSTPIPKIIDQPLHTLKGRLTENGKFFRAATDYKNGLVKKPHLIKVYEKIAKGIWCYKGFFELFDAKLVPSASRKVLKFYLKPIRKRILGQPEEILPSRLIPTSVKVEVWRRDHGCCVICQSKVNLHYDHDIPHSKGGSSFTVDNVRLLCAKHNLQKSDKIMSLLPWIYIGAGTAAYFHKN